jgi:hypothetical protein
MNTLEFGFIASPPYKRRLALDVPKRIFEVLKTYGADPKEASEESSLLRRGQGDDLTTVQVKKLAEGDARLVFKLSRRQGVNSSEHQQKRLRNVLSILHAVQVIATPEERDPLVLLAPSLQHRSPGVYPFASRVAWSQYTPDQSRLFAIEALEESAEMLGLRSAPSDSVWLSRTGGVTIAVDGSNRLLSTGPEYRRTDPYFKLRAEAMNYAQQTAFAVASIAIARPELLA